MSRKLPETSIIIRTKNEAKSIKKTLDALFEQTYRDFEIIVIDSQSRDDTVKIAKSYPITVLEIPARDFSYPYALNYAMKHAHATKYFVSIPAHALPISNTWLADGISNFERYPKVCGVYGFIKPLQNGTIYDKLIMNLYKIGLFLRTKDKQLVLKKPQFSRLKGSRSLTLVPFWELRDKIQIQKEWTKGLLGNTNAIILKSLWKKHNYNEKYGAGGEDEEWGDYWTKRGFIVIKDPKFTVYHSHNLSFTGWIRQLNEWSKISNKERPFRVLPFRTNG